MRISEHRLWAEKAVKITALNERIATLAREELRLSALIKDGTPTVRAAVLALAGASRDTVELARQGEATRENLKNIEEALKICRRQVADLQDDLKAGSEFSKFLSRSVCKEAQSQYHELLKAVLAALQQLSSARAEVAEFIADLQGGGVSIMPPIATMQELGDPISAVDSLSRFEEGLKAYLRDGTVGRSGIFMR